MSAQPSSRPGVTHLTWLSEFPLGCVRVSRHPHKPENRFEFQPHDHEFAEFMWIAEGEAEHHINGRVEYLPAHSFRCIRPHDVHVVYAREAMCADEINISFQPELLTPLSERYGLDWPWQPTGEPRGGLLTPTMRERLSAWLEILATPKPRRIDLDSFLLDLTRMLSSTTEGGARATNLPTWLAHVLDTFAEPRHLRGGVPELARLCGRSQEHLNRVVRSCQGRRATDLVNAIRMDWVASQLHITERSIEDLAAECGLANLAHFYRLFRTAYGTTPAAWRKELRNELPPSQPMNMAPWANRK
jgi:AraC family cel operon transcriptional repressor